MFQTDLSCAKAPKSALNIFYDLIATAKLQKDYDSKTVLVL